MLILSITPSVCSSSCRRLADAMFTLLDLCVACTCHNCNVQELLFSSRFAFGFHAYAFMYDAIRASQCFEHSTSGCGAACSLPHIFRLQADVTSASRRALQSPSVDVYLYSYTDNPHHRCFGVHLTSILKSSSTQPRYMFLLARIVNRIQTSKVKKLIPSEVLPRLYNFNGIAKCLGKQFRRSSPSDYMRSTTTLDPGEHCHARHSFSSHAFQTILWVVS